MIVVAKADSTLFVIRNMHKVFYLHKLQTVAAPVSRVYGGKVRNNRKC